MRYLKRSQLHCLCRMIVYNIHSGVKKTPLHMMLGYALNASYRRKSLLIAFNRIGSCTSYHTIISARSILASYVVKCLADGEQPIQSTFTREVHTIAGIDNSNSIRRQSSLSGTMDSHYAAKLLFQYATLNKPFNKPSQLQPL